MGLIRHLAKPAVLILGLLCLTAAPTLLAPQPTLLAATTAPTPEPPQSWIVMGHQADAVAAAVEQSGGNVTHRLAIIGGVAARLTPSQVATLQASDAVSRVWQDQPVHMAASPVDPYGLADIHPPQAKANNTYTHYPAQTGAGILHAFGVDGSGVTVAVVDTGFWAVNGLTRNADNQKRVLAQYDAFTDQVVSRDSKGVTTDENGHGTHISGIIADSSKAYGFYRGVAPGVDLVSVRAFDADGVSTYSDVIRGLDWVVANKDALNVRVMNLSFGAAPQSFYFDDPLNKAVMRAWSEGIVVVTSAGNGGPDPFTISAPGNVPYIITVGAVTDSYTPYSFSDDKLTSFSAAGPTAAGWVKPDLVSYGGHVLATLAPDTTIGTTHPDWAVAPRFHRLSGTSQASAVTSGVAALLIQSDPSLTPDDVKCRLMSSAMVALDAAGGDAYNPLQQGSGLVNAVTAVLSDASGCANVGLDIKADLAGTQHWGGPVRMDEDGNLYIQIDGQSHFLWDGSYTPIDGVTFATFDPWVIEGRDPWTDVDPLVDFDPWVIEGSPNPEFDPWVIEYRWLEFDPWVIENTWIESYPEIYGRVLAFSSASNEKDWMAAKISTEPTPPQE